MANNINTQESDAMQIPLTQGYFALVDFCDYELINQFNWFAGFTSGDKVYAARNTSRKSGKSIIRMHTVIMNAKWVDHVNGNGLDNRRQNLRLCSPSQNACNRSKDLTNASSRFKGVTWDGTNKKWKASIKINCKQIWLGRYADEEQAARAYNEAALKFHKDFACLNSID